MKNYCLTKGIKRNYLIEIEESELDKVLNVLSVMTDKTRMKILFLLMENGEMCICEISPLLGITRSAVSQHLSTLKKVSLLSVRKDGKFVYYSIKNKNIRKLIISFKEFIRKEVKDGGIKSNENNR
ncbi:MAG: transcriptional regulator [Caldiserica bacterium]|nr:MAG: transcriptional regulator [Caldisericota bacterium]